MPMSHYIAGLRAKVGHDLLATTAAAVALFDEIGRLLFVKLADTGEWSLPGGAIDPDERPADGAARECYEETGLRVRPTKLIGVFGGPEFRVTYPNGDVTCYTTIVFQAQKVGGTFRADGVETLDVRYFTRDECARLLMSPSCRTMVARIFDPHSWPHFAQSTRSRVAGQVADCANALNVTHRFRVQSLLKSADVERDHI
jgi:8-oxo-dGTP pyrophosphatase MutT (NUDIX family)